MTPLFFFFWWISYFLVDFLFPVFLVLVGFLFPIFFEFSIFSLVRFCSLHFPRIPHGKKEGTTEGGQLNLILDLGRRLTDC